VQRLVRDLNRLYRSEPALHQLDFSDRGFEWVAFDDADASVIAFLRKPTVGSTVLVVCNLTPTPRHGYRLGVPSGGHWRELMNTDAVEYGGSGLGNMGGANAVGQSWHGKPCSLQILLPPLATLVFKHESDEQAAEAH
jgi:1,4-alpha-glucan branching enzyme